MDLKSYTCYMVFIDLEKKYETIKDMYKAVMSGVRMHVENS